MLGFPQPSAATDAAQQIPVASGVNGSSYTPAEVGGLRRWQHGATAGFGGGLMWCNTPPWQDPNVTARALEYLHLAVQRQRPFFLAVGL